MHTITHPPTTQVVVGGIDTHRDTHTAAVITTQGALLGARQFPATGSGYQSLLEWLVSFGIVEKVGIEGTGAYGAGLTRHLTAAGVTVVEVDRPDRAARRKRGKSDPIDAENAARAALSGHAIAVPKDRSGPVEALRNLRIARSDAVTHRAECITKIKAVLVTAPDVVRDRFHGLSTTATIALALSLRPSPGAAAGGDPAAAVKMTLRSLARTHRHLSNEIDELDALIEPLIEAINPRLLRVNGIGLDTAGQLLVTAGQNPDRLHSEAAFAMLCGAAPIPASSGRTNRHRLNRGGDRQANKALWRITLCRMSTDPRTKAYVAKRTAEGLSKPEIMRCLKRYIAREIFPLLTT